MDKAEQKANLTHSNTIVVTFQQRVIWEKEALDEKISKLEPFIKSPTFNTLEPDEQKRLIYQLDLMQKYSGVLGERIDNFSK